MSSDISHFSASRLSALLRSEEISSQQIAECFLDRVDAVDSEVGAFLDLNRERVLAQAKASDERRAANASLGPLDGIPVGIKDVIAVKDEPLTCASRILENFVSPYDATVTTRLRQAGAILFGRLNLDEFAMGSSTENSAFKTTANPWNLERVPGGSSGGSAAAVAAGEVPVSLGSDTGGSIRQPAALCGIVGMKPTYGLVSRFGLAAYASSLDQIGPLGRSVEDCALLLQTIAGHDDRDSTSLNEKTSDYSSELSSPVRGKRIGVPGEYFRDGLDSAVRERVQAVIDWYQSNGCEIVSISLPHTDLAIPVYYILAPAEASSNLARYDGIRYGRRTEMAEDGIDLYFKSRGQGFGPEVKRRIILGTYVLSSGYYDAYYIRAQKVRSLVRKDFTDAFREVDVILTPTTPSVAFKAGDKKDDPLSMYLEDIFTVPTNLAGLPAISLPCGFNSDHLPVGFQLIGRPLDEARLLGIANAYEREHPWSRMRPQLGTTGN